MLLCTSALAPSAGKLLQYFSVLSSKKKVCLSIVTLVIIP